MHARMRSPSHRASLARAQDDALGLYRLLLRHAKEFPSYFSRACCDLVERLTEGRPVTMAHLKTLSLGQEGGFLPSLSPLR
jgi:hypothetical protein